MLETDADEDFNQGGTAVPVKAKDDEEGATQWMNPLVDAKRGILAASKGRLRR